MPQQKIKRPIQKELNLTSFAPAVVSTLSTKKQNNFLEENKWLKSQ
jgi:hypothetical protein